MHRTQIYLPEEAYEELQNLGRRFNLSLAELIRQAVDRYLREARRDSRQQLLRQGFGLWSDLSPEVSSQEMVEHLRSEWSGRSAAALDRH